MAPGDDATRSAVLTHPGILAPSSLSIGGSPDIVSARPEPTRPSAIDVAERFPRLYRLLRVGCTPLLRWLFDLRVTGVEHLPSSGPFVLAANHHNYVDGVVLGVALPRPIAFLVMPRVFNASPLHPPFHRRVGSIPVNLERPDPGAIKRVLRVLDNGHVVGIFPEGPFSRDGHMVPGQPGVAMIALRSGVPVVPAAIEGTYEALVGRRFYLPRRHPLSVRFGAPMHFGRPRHRRVTRTEREEITRRIMGEIASLLEAEREPIARANGRVGRS
jgi:1-acyl-sn-glycerol-3-phosphate acyltransferase